MSSCRRFFYFYYYRRPTTRSHRDTDQPRFQSDLAGSYESGLLFSPSQRAISWTTRTTIYYITLFSFFLLMRGLFCSGCCSELMKRESRFIVALWTPSGAIRCEDSGVQGEVTSGKEGKNITVTPPHEYQERFQLCPLWIAISWRVQVRKCAMWGPACLF